MDSSYYLSLFLDEGREKLHQVGQALAELESAPDDAERLAQVFREIHSFKGNADTMGFEALAGLAHAMEHVLDGLRTGGLTPEPVHMRMLGRALLGLELNLAAVEASSEGPPIDGLVAELEAVAALIVKPAEREPDPVFPYEPEVMGPRLSERSRTYRVEITLDPACFIKGTRAFMITTALEMQGAVLDVTPSLEELDWPEAGNAFQVLVMSDAEPAALEAGLADIGEILKVAIHAQGEAASQVPAALALGEAERTALARALAGGKQAYVVSTTFLPHCRMPGARAMLVLHALGELGEAIKAEPAPATIEDEGFAQAFHVLVATAEAPDRLREALFRVAEVLTVGIEAYESAELVTAVVPQALAPAVDDAPGAPEGLLPGIAAFPEPAGERELELSVPRRSRVLRIAADRFEELEALAERLHEANARVARLAHARDHGTGGLADAAADAATLAAALREELGRLRRVPIEAVFNRFPRMVRELAHELGKQVNLQILGAEVELDRALADELGDLLVHLLRNAMDHGLETPAERHAAGKGATGTLQLAARREAGHVVVTVADDGRGLDVAKIVATAVARGRLAAADAARIGDDAAYELIFEPGFSTAQATTRLSGRGVGLDAVKSKAEALGGRLLVESAGGRGTIFQLRFPAREPASGGRTDERVGA